MVKEWVKEAMGKGIQRSYKMSGNPSPRIFSGEKVVAESAGPPPETQPHQPGQTTPQKEKRRRFGDQG